MRRLAPALAALSFLAVLATGLADGTPMVADEVVHYYLLVNQAGHLARPTVKAVVPMEGWRYERYYPHVFLWHYAGAIVWKISGGSFRAVQLFHALFWLQLLAATWAIARDREEKGGGAGALPALATMASLPVGLLFAVLLYQDVPATAQAVTAFWLLSRRRLWPSVLFMALALNMKETAFVFLPVYFPAIAAFFRGETPPLRLALRLGVAALLLAASCAPMAVTLERMGFNYYPTKQIKRIVLEHFGHGRSFEDRPVAGDQVEEGDAVRPEIANHPGDLRIPSNWYLYFGALWWVLLGAALLAVGARASPRPAGGPWERHWPLVTGAWYAAATAYMMRTAPDARFFLPAFPFLVIAAGERVAGLPRRRVWVWLVVLVALLQGGAVLAKAHSLRRISPGMREAIDFLREYNRSSLNTFMYPEGHERFIPGSVGWYLGYELRDFWRADNDERLRLLAKYRQGLIVIKKYRIRDIGPDAVDLGSYPRSFVEDIRGDRRFRKIFENDEVEIYLVPRSGEG